jgi:MFS transporter, DHA1 family, multidrug resistance protein
MTAERPSAGATPASAAFLSTPGTRGIFLTLCVLIMINQFGFGLITPVLPLYADSFGLGPEQIGIVIGIYGLARFIVNVPAGRLAEARGRRVVLIGGTLVTALASLLTAFAQNLPQLLILRLVTGAGAGAVLITGQIMVGDLSTPANRGRMMSVYQGFFLVGVGLGPAPGGILAEFFGLRAPFIAYSAFSAAAALVALFAITETKPAAPSTPPAARPDTGSTPTRAPMVGLRAIVLGPAFLLISAVTFVQFFARTGAIFNVVPLLGREHLGLTAGQIGLSLTLVNVLNIAVLYHAGVLSDRLGRKPVIGPSTVISGLSMAAFAFSDSYLAFLGAALLWGLASGISGPSPGAYIADIAPAEVRGRIFGIYRSCSDFGYIVGPLLLGWLTAVAGYHPPLLLTAALFVLSGSLFMLFAPETHPRGATAG